MSINAERAEHRTRVNEEDEFLSDIVSGLAARPRTISSKWLYDVRGSQLFEKITQLPEYYLTRAETEILRARAHEIAHLTDLQRAIVEFGSGPSLKTLLLLNALSPSAYVAIDVSNDYLRDSTASLARAFPSLPIHTIVGDFTRPMVLPEVVADRARLGFFSGSTIGNLTVPMAVEFLRLAARTLGDDAMLLIGIDRIKDPDVLRAAYDDAQGVTAEFNRNLLFRVNRELAGTIPVEAFRHVALWNDCESRVEMHLEATRAVQFTVGGHAFSMAEGESIHTENSLKYGPRAARVLLRAGGWSPVTEWTDSEGRFALFLAENTSSLINLKPREARE